MVVIVVPNMRGNNHTTRAEMAATDDLLALIGRDTELRRVASTHGGEYAGPCPWCGGRDRFRVWPERGRWWCRQCDKSGDATAYRVERGDLTPTEAGRLRHAGDGAQGERPARSVAAPRHAERLAPPGSDWQRAARAFCEGAEARLWETPDALAYLRGRALSDDTIRAAGLGWWDPPRPDDVYRDPSRWGLDRERLWIPRGWVIPWELQGAVWRVNIRQAAGEPKYCAVAGARNALYGADELAYGRPAVLVEGELDALTIRQAAGDVVAPVATGSTHGARRPPWVARLAMASTVLVAFDTDEAGEKAATWWLSVLSNAQRWRPLWNDASAMAQDGADVRAWVLAGLGDTPDDDTAALEREALALLDRMATDPDVRRQYAEIAQRAGWPCFGMSWAEWVAEVT